MLVLALDTSTPAVTVAVHDGTAVLAEATEISARRHGELLAPMLRDALAVSGRSVADVTDVVVGVGPGPFTSLRIGITSALALAIPGRLPVHGVCSLDVLAREASTDEAFLVTTDARRREVYWAAYDSTGARTAGPSVDRPHDVAGAYPGLAAAGEGALLYPDSFGRVLAPTYPRAGVLAEFAVAELLTGRALLSPVPLYLRRPDTSEPAARKSVLR